MTHNERKTQADIPAVTVDSFLALSRIYLTSSERLLALNVAALREVLADSGPALQALAGMAAPTGQKAVPDNLGMAQVNRALAYCRGLQDIAAQAQDEISELLLHPLRETKSRHAANNPWPSILAAFSPVTPLSAKGNGGVENLGAPRRRA
jgi:hypothetical protein